MYIEKFEIDPNWCVIEDTFDASRVRHNESVMALGAGNMTVRSSIDEGLAGDPQNITYDRMAMNVSLEVTPFKKSRWGNFIQIVQGRHPFWNVGIVNLPYFLGMEVYADGEKLDMETCKISGYKRWLDMKTATLYRTFVWETKSGRRLNLLFTRYMDPADRFVCVQDLRIKNISGGGANITVKSYVDNDVRTNGFDKFTSRAVGFAGDQVIYSDITANLGDRVMTVSRMKCDREASYATTREERRISSSLVFPLAEGSETRVLKASAQMASEYFNAEALLDESCIFDRCFLLWRQQDLLAHNLVR
jgi:kojibiose phosphorylase